MSILVFLESAEGKVKKSSLEAASYAAAMAEKEGGEVTAVVMGDLEQAELEATGKHGVSKVLNITNEKLQQGIIQAYASALAEIVEKENVSIVVLAKSSLGDPVAARLAVKIKASLASNVTDLPDTTSGFKVRRSIYTGKAFAYANLTADKKILAIKKNAIALKEDGGNATVEKLEVALNDADFATSITSTEKATGEVLLPEAEIVVSGGRGLKGPENWGMIEDLAKSLGAATACSKPVSDMDWRPHHEHVGQTGIKVSPSLYIAVGI